MEVGGQRHAPAALPPGKRPGTHCIGGWVGPRAGLEECGKSRPNRDSISRPSSSVQVATLTELSRSIILNIYIQTHTHSFVARVFCVANWMRFHGPNALCVRSHYALWHGHCQRTVRWRSGVGQITFTFKSRSDRDKARVLSRSAHGQDSLPESIYMQIS